jgi:hypothetical protein
MKDKSLKDLLRVLSRIDRKGDHSNKNIAKAKQGIVEAIIALNKIGGA